jgi:MSHA biogenesis protein MshN
VSLINDMLRDLERRRPASEGEVLAGVHGVPPAAGTRARLHWGALGLLVLAAGVAYWLVTGALAGAASELRPGPPQMVQAPPEVQPVIEVVAMAEPVTASLPDPLEPVEATPRVRWVGVATEQRPDELRLTLRFSASPEREPALVMDDDGGRLHLADVDLTHAPPLPAAPAEGPLRALGLNSGTRDPGLGTRDEATLHFRVAPGVRTTLEHGDDGRRLTLTFRAPEPDSEAIAPTLARAEPRRSIPESRPDPEPRNSNP